MLAVRMPVPLSSRIPCNNAIRPWLLGLFAAVGGLVLDSAPVQAQRADGAWIRVPSPLTSEGVTRIKNETQRALRAQGGRAVIVVYHFKGGEPSKYGDAYELAKFIDSEFKGQAESVAFIEGELRGHAVLPALACQKLWMKNDSGLGDAKYPKSQPVEVSERQQYETIAERRGRPVPLVLKMLYDDLTVFEVKPPAKAKGYKLSKEDVTRRNLEAKYALTPDEVNLQPQQILPPGQVGFYPAKQARELGLVSGQEFATEQEVVEALGLPGSVLQGDPLQGKPIRAGWIEINGEIDRGKVETVRRQMRRAIDKEQVNCLIFQIEASGGPQSVESADALAKEIQALGTPDPDGKRSPILTIAYIPGRATGAATYIALGCNQIVMGPTGELGDCKELVYKGANQPFKNEDITPRQNRLMKLAEEQGYSPWLFQGLMDRDLELLWVEKKPDINEPAGQKRIARSTDLKDAAFAAKFAPVDGGTIKKKGELLKFKPETALEYGVARHKTAETSLESVAAMYGIDPKDIVRIRSDWLDQLVNILAHPVTTVFLVIIGFTCLILELKAPGVTLPAIIAAVCFILVFWSHSWLSREVNSLAILLFLLGLVLLGVEIFVLPGFGVAGISGIVLLLLSLALVMVQKWPQSQAEYLELGKYLGFFGGGLIASLFAAYTLARYLPNIPFANRLVLQPPEEEAGEAASASPFAQAAALLGTIGVATTTLRPAGKARFGDQYLDVVAEGHYVEAGSRVQVIEIDGTRIVVKSA